jgi:hypothetical protein
MADATFHFHNLLVGLATLSLMALGPWLWYRAVWALTRNNPRRKGRCSVITLIILAEFIVLFDILEVQLQESATPFVIGLAVFFGAPLAVLFVAILLERRWPPLPPIADLDRSHWPPHDPLSAPHESPLSPTGKAADDEGD